MLEKLGLPAKPSGRGRSWVIDASHCQKCATAFNFLNRKHHCRRCGGIFCGKCVQSRMYLRGQGDAPVRICDPCKILEEAARFEARHGRKKKDETDPEAEDALKLLLKDTVAESPSSSGSSGDPVTPELLRQNAQEEKQRYVTLKKEGRTGEATKAFKRSKELERQADALALALRKSSRQAAKALKTSTKEPAESLRTETIQASSPLRKTTRASIPPKKVKSTGEDAVLDELKELGWSEADLNKKEVSDADILAECGGQKTGKAAEALQAEILGHKKKALAHKREGKLAEAKEELKQAKLLERRLEEIQTLGEDEDEEDDGDEVAAMLRALEKEAALPVREVSLSEGGLPVFTEDDDDDNMDVSDTDLTDPDLMAALKSMGWAEEPGTSNPPAKQAERLDLQAEILSHKRKALALKRAGNVAEARKELSQAKALEERMKSSRPAETESAVQDDELVEHDVEVTEKDMHDPDMLSALQALGFGGDDTKANRLALQQEVHDEDEEEDPVKHIQDLTADPEIGAMLKGLSLGDETVLGQASEAVTLKVTSKSTTRVSRPPPPPASGKSKRELQQELLYMKRRAMALRREGKTEEAEKLTKEASVLDMQLKALEEPEKGPVVTHEENEESEEDEEVTEDDMNDPALLAALNAIGFKDEPVLVQASKAPATSKVTSKTSPPPPPVSGKSKRELQQELLHMKRRAIVLRREGKTEEAEKLNKEASVLDMQLKAMEEPEKEAVVTHEENEESEEEEEVTEDDMNDPALLAALKAIGFKDKTPPRKEKTPVVPASETASATLPVPAPDAQLADDDASGFDGEYGEIGQVVDIVPPFLVPAFFSKPKESSSKSEPQVLREEQRKDKDLIVKQTLSQEPQASVRNAEEKQSSSQGVEQQILMHKRKALSLKRSGDKAGALEELRLAKDLEKRVQGSSATQNVRVASVQAVASVQVEVVEKQKKAETRSQSSSGFKDRMKLQRESLAHKRKAMALRREGKTNEADAEFELAKSLEKQLEEMEGYQPASFPAPGALDDDVMDPQLVAALSGLGWKETEVHVARQPAEQDSSGNIKQRIQSLKLRALELKQAGKKQEALEILREAKKLESTR